NTAAAAAPMKALCVSNFPSRRELSPYSFGFCVCVLTGGWRAVFGRATLATDARNKRGFGVSRILLGVSGGIAAYKACELVRLFVQRGHEVRVVATRNALEFVSPLTLQTLSGSPVRHELLAASAESEISHIELADWAEAFVVAPATANVLAKLAQ